MFTDNWRWVMEEKTSYYQKLKKFRDTYKDLESVYDMFPKLCGLAGTEFWALSMIYDGISTQHAICEHLSISRQTVNSAFRQLKKRGFIHLETMDTNLREKQVYLTEGGKEFVSQSICSMHKLEENVWKKMSEDEKEQIISLIGKYKSLLADEIEEYKKK